MKIITGFLALVLLSILVLSSCAPDPNTEQAVPITLSVSPLRLNLSSPADTQSTRVSLSCGCDFTLVFKPLSGDTTKIQSSGIPAYSVSTSPHAVRFYAASTTPKGSYSASYDIAVYEDHAAKYLHDTVVVNLNVP